LVGLERETRDEVLHHSMTKKERKKTIRWERRRRGE
jgi:hypothetical protein